MRCAALRGKQRHLRVLRLLAAALFVFAALGAAGAATVTGRLTASSGAVAGRQLHFENRVTSDIFLAPVSADGTFSADLPPGQYQLRDERGTVMVPDINVGEANLSLGNVSAPSGWNPLGIFDSERVGEAIVRSPAPSTADLPEEGGFIEMPAVPALPASANQ